MPTWVTDGNGNRASVERWGSEYAARAALKTLIGCMHCTDCMYCTDCADCMYCAYCKACTDCKDCTGCTGCTYCTDCTGCTDCTRCTHCARCTECTDCRGVHAVQYSVIAGPTRSDGHQFVVGSGGAVHAGCRVFPSFASAREHWRSTRGGTKLGDETMRIIDWLEAEYAARRPK